jgi:hypothetical protein
MEDPVEDRENAPVISEGTPKERRTSRSLLTKLALAGAAVLLVLAGAEVVLRLGGYRERDAEREMDNLLAKMVPARTQGLTNDERVEGTKQLPVLHPYLGYGWVEDDAQLASDLTYFQGEESRRAFDVLLVGGSVAASFGITGAPVLSERLAADEFFRDRPVRVFSYGRGGYKEPQQLLLVAYLFTLGFQPDAVLAIDGFNECALGNANLVAHVNPAQPSVAHWAHLAADKSLDREALDLLAEMRGPQREASAWIERARRYHLTQSALLGTLVSARIGALRREYVAAATGYVKHLTAAPSPAVTGPPFPDDPDTARELLVHTWFESSRSLDALCRGRGIPYLHVLQPTLHDTGSKPLTAEETKNGACLASWSDGVHFGYPRLRALGAELRTAGVAFLDASQVFHDVTESLYYDPCHVSPRGNELLANAIAPALLEAARAAR